MNTKKIEVVLKLTSPLHISSPEAFKVDSKTMKPAYGDQKADPATAVIREPVYLAPEKNPDLKKKEGKENDKRPSSMTRVPVIPSNTLRGRLRRKAAERIIDYCDQTNRKLTLEALHVLTCGAFSGQPDTKDLSLDERDRQLENAYFAAFGGGPRLMRSGFAVSIGYPINEFTLLASLVPPSQQVNASSQLNYELTSFIHMRRSDDVLEFSDTLNPNTIENYPESVLKWLDAVATNADARKKARQNKGDDKDKEKVKKAALKSLTITEIINPGTPFYFDLSIPESLPQHATGGLILALGDTLKVPLGGKTHNGFGRFTASASLDGQSVLDDEGNPNIDNAFVSNAVDAYNEWLAQFTPEQIQFFLEM